MGPSPDAHGYHNAYYDTYDYRPDIYNDAAGYNDASVHYTCHDNDSNNNHINGTFNDWDTSATSTEGQH
jgi:hypothetical protein